MSRFDNTVPTSSLITQRLKHLNSILDDKDQETLDELVELIATQSYSNGYTQGVHDLH